MTNGDRVEILTGKLREVRGTVISQTIAIDTETDAPAQVTVVVEFQRPDDAAVRRRVFKAKELRVLGLIERIGDLDAG